MADFLDSISRWVATIPIGALYALLGLAAFVEGAKASGFVAAALQRHGIRGALVAPAAPV